MPFGGKSWRIQRRRVILRRMEHNGRRNIEDPAPTACQRDRQRRMGESHQHVDIDGNKLEASPVPAREDQWRAPLGQTLSEKRAKYGACAGDYSPAASIVARPF